MIINFKCMLLLLHLDLLGFLWDIKVPAYVQLLYKK